MGICLARSSLWSYRGPKHPGFGKPSDRSGRGGGFDEPGGRSTPTPAFGMAKSADWVVWAEAGYAVGNAVMTGNACTCTPPRLSFRKKEAMILPQAPALSRPAWTRPPGSCGPTTMCMSGHVKVQASGWGISLPGRARHCGTPAGGGTGGGWGVGRAGTRASDTMRWIVNAMCSSSYYPPPALSAQPVLAFENSFRPRACKHAQFQRNAEVLTL